MQLAITCDAGSKTTIKAFEFGDNLQQAKIITLVHSHQTNEAFWFDYGLRDKLVVEQHAVNIAQQSEHKRLAIYVPEARHKSENSGSHSSLNAGTIENPARYFFNRKLGRINVRDPVTLEYFLGLP